MSKTTKNQFDIIVIGDNWTGLLLASSLSKKYSVALINSKQRNTLYPTTKNLTGDFEYLPLKENSLERIEWLNNLSLIHI